MMISLPLFPLVVKRSSEVILNFQMVWDDWLKWVPHLDPVKEPLTPVTLMKVVLLKWEIIIGFLLLYYVLYCNTIGINNNTSIY